MAGRYQGALAIFMWRRSTNKELVFKVENEPDNVRDTNALKFMVFHNDKWHIVESKKFLNLNVLCIGMRYIQSRWIV